jgi:hypothetical protein
MVVAGRQWRCWREQQRWRFGVCTVEGCLRIHGACDGGCKARSPVTAQLEC